VEEKNHASSNEEPGNDSARSNATTVGAECVRKKGGVSTTTLDAQ